MQLKNNITGNYVNSHTEKYGLKIVAQELC